MYTLAIAAAKGGVGKTTIAAATCVAAPTTDPGASVGLVDLDPQGSATRWWNDRRQPSPIHISVGREPLAGVCRRARGDGCTLLVLDCPPGFSDISLEAIGTADLVLIPTGASELDLTAVEATVEMARQANKPYRLVLNRAVFRSRLAGRAVTTLRAAGGLLMPTVHQRVAIAAAMTTGATALETEPEGAGARELMALWYGVRAVLGAAPVRLRPEDLVRGRAR